MQTRLLAAASGALVVLGLSLLAFRPAVARSRGEAAVLEGRSGLGHLGGTSTWSCGSDTTPLLAPRTAAPAELPPELRAQLALTIADPLQRTGALADALTAWAACDAGAALIWLAQHPEQDTRLLVVAVGEGLAEDPVGTTFALTLLAQDHDLGTDLAVALVRTLAEQDRSAAAARLACATPEGWAHEWATVAFATLAFEDSATALAALDSVGQPDLHRTAATALVAGWAERDPAELARSCAAFPLSADRALALATVAKEFGYTAAPPTLGAF